MSDQETIAARDRRIKELEAENHRLREALDDLLEQCTTEVGNPEDYIAALKQGNAVINGGTGDE